MLVVRWWMDNLWFIHIVEMLSKWCLRDIHPLILIHERFIGVSREPHSDQPTHTAGQHHDLAVLRHLMRGRWGLCGTRCSVGLPPIPNAANTTWPAEAVDWRVDLSLRLRWYLKVRHLKDVKIEGTRTTEAHQLDGAEAPEIVALLR